MLGVGRGTRVAGTPGASRRREQRPSAGACVGAGPRATSGAGLDRPPKRSDPEHPAGGGTRARPRVRLVVTADDFGYCPRRDEGIVEAFLAGAVTSVSLLVNGSAAGSAAELARR